ncbi:hypothetical protein BU14_0950s0004 [Porphyra umbilicalis]|uniref:Uncharacterized protein n=1 Tax=Porphyra umbilicalis TaxID=2786 RepID=A0A1X6NN76_PORUM|nr:hypothetical protein BU14_0950s0004 [Porphyra umbilicalis]|eukprot:OSX70022.1 hypothetical protein BU14_0950s0004 [Porphyra umbilicalis]
MAGYYPLMAVAKGCIGFTGTNARPSIAPLGGVQPMLGTNPITFGCGSDDPFPYVLDCATSINQRGKIERYAREGMPTPAGQVIDKQGIVRTDTDGILKDLTTRQCALAPLGGVSMDTGAHKGTGYATLCEILSTALQGNPTSPELTGVDQATGKPAPMPLGHWFIAIDVERFTEVSTFNSRVGGLLRELRSSEKNLVVSGSDDGTLRVWDADRGECVAVLNGHSCSVSCVCVVEVGGGGDGVDCGCKVQRVVSGSDDHTLRVWDADRGECVAVLKGHSDKVMCVCVVEVGGGGDGGGGGGKVQRVVSGSADHMLRVWDAGRGECVAVLEGHSHWVRCVCVVEVGGGGVGGGGAARRSVWCLGPGTVRCACGTQATGSAWRC